MQNKDTQQSFEVVSGELVVNDPAFNKEDSNLIKNVKKGQYKVHVQLISLQVARVKAYHESQTLANLQFSTQGPSFSVDSGQGCIVDAAHHQNHDNITWNPKNEFMLGQSNKWYGAVCDITQGLVTSKEYYGFLPYGFVSVSGCGDGGYESKIAKNSDGEVVGVEIIYFNDNEIEEMTNPKQQVQISAEELAKMNDMKKQMNLQ